MLKHQVITNAHLLRDLTSDYDIFESSEFRVLHRQMLKDLPEREEMPLPEMNASEATRESVVAMSRDFTVPMVVRGALTDATSVTDWTKKSFWMDSYADETVVTTSASRSEIRTLREFFEPGSGLYVAGATAIFERHPELKAMIDNDVTRMMMPDGPEVGAFFYQMFMGWKDQGTTVHCAIGTNIFRQIAGQKKWYFLPPSQTPYVYPKMYTNGYSATSKTVQSTRNGVSAPWWNKLERYTVTLNPGDILVNPAWWWHCVENFGDQDQLVIGCPTRFDSPDRAMVIDEFKTLIATWKALTTKRKFSNKSTGLNAALAFEESLVQNREETYQMLALK